MAPQKQSNPEKVKTHQTADIEIVDIKFEHRRDALGIGTGHPRLSWIIETSRKNWLQAAYQVELRDPDGTLLETSPKIQSADSALVPWPFEPLQSRQEVALRVSVWGADGSTSTWSQPETLEAGLLERSDWEAQFIGINWEEDITEPQPSPLFRREFTLRPGLKKARLYASALGLYELEINGKKVGDQLFSPGWTSYQHRLHYQTYDITPLLNEGENAIGAILGEGWYRGRIGLDGGRRNIWGNKLGLLVQIELHYEDGYIEKILSDQTWRCTTGPILMSSIYDGETYDARLEQPGWSNPNFDDSDWSPVVFVDYDLANLRAPQGPPIRQTETVSPIEILTSPSGRLILDFGQNLVGWLRIKVSGEAGQPVTLRHAEVLEEGELCTWPLREANATDVYILKGDAVETWEPKFTFHGFRYAEVDGWPGELQKEDIQAIVLHSDMERTGWFGSSNQDLNQLHQNVVWSMRGNFLGVPTDCPQRAERLGWTGDIQVFSPTACFLYDVAGLLSSWLADLACDQQDHQGVVPYVVPNTIINFVPVAAWGDAATVVPWVLYQCYGDKRILEKQYDSMRDWVEVLANVAGENYLWDHGFQFGDWLDPNAPQENPAAAKTDPYLLATAYFAHSTDILAKTASLLGITQDAIRYTELTKKIRSAFAEEYVTPAGRLMSDAATAYCLALAFDLLPTVKQRVNAVKRLARIVRESDHHISTGFIGTPLVCDALCDHGYSEEAYKLLMQTTMPSWLYPVTKGATTIWERWDAIRPDGTIPKSGMLSFNHYAFGAVADWLHRTVAGIVPAEPGYRKIRFQPVPGPGLTHALTRHKSPYGMVEGGWKIDDEQIVYHLKVPPNTTADVCLREAHLKTVQVGSGDYTWEYPSPL